MPDGVHPVRRPVDEQGSRRANRTDWDAYADEYQSTHGDFLGDVGFVWGPEGHQERDLQVLGDPAGLAGLEVLEVGCGAAQCSRWLATQGARVVGLDLSERQLQHSRRIDEATGVVVPTVCATATALPFPDDAFDVVFSSFGALQFVADGDVMVGEVARVTRPDGVFAFSVTHPIRWSMPDDAGPEGMTVTSSYWDRTPYVEEDEDGRPRYVEHHRTLGDWADLLWASGFAITALHEPQWPEGLDRVWGGWGPLRGRLIPGTAIIVARLLRPPSPVS
ncbi:class I SAM-dependent methyltransferase [Nocardioides marmoribigeumensis]|nr:class I SAM-dependent methyltransferase [Nocardioides marmoribigeumensis]